jgi:hypothetical protein
MTATDRGWWRRRRGSGRLGMKNRGKNKGDEERKTITSHGSFCVV